MKLTRPGDKDRITAIAQRSNRPQ